MKPVLSLITALLLLSPPLPSPADPLSDATFSYDGAAPLHVQTIATRREGPVTIREVRFPSPKGGTIHAEILTPARRSAHRAGVLFVHWLGDPKTTNLSEFYRDAVTVAQRGSVAMLIDAMWAQKDWYEKGRTPETDYANSIKQVIDLRRSLDVLLHQPGVDSDRIAYVGHDFGAMYGAVLSGVDPRPRWYVLMAGNPSFYKWYTYEAKPKDDAAFRAQMDQLSPGQYLARSKGEAFLFQFANKDQYITTQEAVDFASAAPLPHGMFVYKADHSLNVLNAFADRMAWLEERLNPAP